ncbi:hypothetical protein EVAR_28917_1 [Eumeta japonica]|uniref:DNA helicase Pif1-like 2B domain-containing protein n=1 Tax=Eumeta variegata TaxID=151549 RepID=A0A4C1YNR6_EUMVA|nr:hypothetical protein EVAR_28917_1 [Eumeta japonica]
MDKPPGLSSHKLVLKVGCPVILLRNLYPSNDLRTRTRFEIENEIEVKLNVGSRQNQEPKRDRNTKMKKSLVPGFVHIETVIGSGIRIESGTENKIENGNVIKIKSGTEIQNRTGDRTAQRSYLSLQERAFNASDAADGRDPFVETTLGTVSPSTAPRQKVSRETVKTRVQKCFK